MENEVKIVGMVCSEYEKVTTKHKSTFYFFKIKVKRSNVHKINLKDEDIFNCMVSEHVESNPDKNLMKDNLVRIKGNMQSNLVVKNDFPFVSVYIVVDYMKVENNLSLSQTKPSIIKSEPTPRVKSTYYRGQHYSSAKPYHDNFPSEQDTRGKIKCTCGYLFIDSLEYCPSCGKCVTEIYTNK